MIQGFMLVRPEGYIHTKFQFIFRLIDKRDVMIVMIVIDTASCQGQIAIIQTGIVSILNTVVTAS